MNRTPRQYKTIDGILYRLCECRECSEYILVGKTSHGVERRFINGHNKGNYKDGRTYELKEWKVTVKERDNYTCQRCFGKHNKLLEAHHIKSKEEYPELIYDVDNGVTLCKSCHSIVHRKINKKLKTGIFSIKSILKKNKAMIDNKNACKNK